MGIAEIESLQFEEQYDPNCNCCRRDVVYPDLLNDNDLVDQMEVVDNIEYEDDPEMNDSIWQELEGGHERNMPENEEEQKLHLEIVLEGMEAAEDELDLPPNTFDYHQFLTELKDQSCMMNSEYSVRKNGAVDIAINSIEKSTIFINILWRTIFFWLKRYNKSEISDKIFSAMFLKDITKKVWLISQDEDMRMLLMVVLAETGGKVALTEEEIGFLSDLANKVYRNLLEVIVSYVRGNISSLAIDDFQVRSMDATGLSKLRYIAGWVIRVIFEKSRRYVASNMYSESDEVGKRVDAHMLKVRLLKQNIIIPYDLFYKTTGCKPTLEYTENRTICIPWPSTFGG